MVFIKLLVMQTTFIHRRKPDNPQRNLIISQHINAYLEVLRSDQEPDMDNDTPGISYHACFGPKDNMLVLGIIIRAVMKEQAVMQWTNEAVLDAIRSYAALNRLVELMMVHKHPFETIYESQDSLLKETPRVTGFRIEELDF